MSDYLKPSDPDAFLDWPPVRERPAHLPKSSLCPVCQGHGGWNLQVNAYSMRDNDRHNMHFKCHCEQCNGYGWTNDVDCIHNYERTRNVGKCLNEYTCVKCKKMKVVDSSD